MTDSGYVDWTSLSMPSSPYVNTGEGQTFVYAFVLADYDTGIDAGIRVFKPNGAHPDWFLHADRADMVLSAQCPPTVSVSGNHRDVLGEDFRSEPLLASLCLGTSDAVYATPNRAKYWSCDHPVDLTRPGRLLLKRLATLYLREPVVLTFLDLRPMKLAAPEAARDQATVSAASGPPR